jgi:hypothetical protein
MVQAHLPLSGNEKQLFEEGKIRLKGDDNNCRPADFEVLDHEKRLVK